jgi:vanillin dehydrogenase
MNPKSYDVIDGVKTYKLFIDGEWVKSSRNALADSLNPAIGKVFARTHQAGTEEVMRAIDAAEAANATWGNTTASEREKALLRICEVVTARTIEIRDMLIDECGSVSNKAMWEIDYVTDLLRSTAGDVRQVAGDTMPMTIPGQISMSVRRPLGIVAGIAPFNSPFLLSMKKVAFSLAAGNTFILKPSEETPISGALIADICAEAGLPKGVLNVVPGIPDEVGKLLMSDPRIKYITFTGSTRTGRYLAVQAATHLKKFSLEMGGKSPLIVLRDASLDYAVNVATFGAFLHQGQVCMASSKVIVEEPLYEEFCKKFAAKAATLKVGDPHSTETFVGPLIRQSQCEFVDGQLSDAKERGAKILTGGTYSDRFFQPTVLRDVDREMRIYHEESFGPVVSVIKVKDSEEALKIANDTKYGLSAAVLTKDIQKAMDLSLRLESGMVHVNDTTISDEPHVPFGGVKESGFGREGGKHSWQELTELKWVTIQLEERDFGL